MPGTVSVSASGNQDIDGILYDRKWAVSSFTFSFPTSASFYQAGSAPNGETASNFDVLNATQQNFVRNYVLSQFAAVANVTFSELTETSSVHADLRFAQSDVPNTAWAYYPASQGYGGDSWYNNSSGNYDNPVVGNYAAHTFLHEVGHAFGLVHGHDSVENPFGALPSAHDSVEYSIMTYRTYVGGPLNGYTYGSASAPQTLMQNDIAALQYLYGANYNTQSGNTTYTWSSTTGRMSIDGVQQAATAGNKIFMTLWDGNGNDTYDFSNYTTNLSVNLQPGAWTTVSSTQLANLGAGHSAAGNIANALLYQGDTRSLIENAIGGTGNDTLVGNTAGNRLDGRGGTDTLTGGIGNDTFVYGSNYGADFITDFIAGNSSGDKLDLGALGITSFSQAMSYATQSGSNTLFNFGGSNTLTLANVTLGNLNAADFTQAPVVSLPSGASVTASSQGQIFQFSSLFAASDPDNDPLTYYVLDDTSGGGRFMINGVVQAEKQWVPVTQAQLSQITFTAGSSGFDNFYFYATDGSLHDYEGVQLHAAAGAVAGSVAISDVQIAEGNSGTKVLTFTVTRSGGTAAFNVNYATADNSATTAGSDYVATSGVLQFGASENTKTISVTINGDTTIESAESFFVNLSGATNGASISDSQAIGTITNDDTQPNQAPVVSLPSGSSVTASSQGQIFQLSSLFAASDPDSDPLTYYVLDDTSGGGRFMINGVVQAEKQWVPVSQGQFSQITFTAGSSGFDNFYFYATDGSLNDYEGVQLHAAAGAVAGSVAISDVQIAEGNSGTKVLTFTVTRSGGTAAFNVNFATADSSATIANGDYVATSGVLQFGASEITKTISVTINGDTTIESAESFFVNLSGATNGASISDSQAIGTITNDDTQPNQAPVVSLPSGSSVTASSQGQIFQLSSLFAASDPDSDPLTYYVLDDTSGGGRFMINGVVQAEKQWVPVAQSQFSQITFTAGSSGFDNFYFYATDGSLNDYEGVQLNAAAPAANQAPVVSQPSGASVTASSQGQVFQFSSLFSASDPDNDLLTYYVLDDTAGASTGHFRINGVTQAESQWVPVTQAQLSQITFTAGAAGSDNFYFYATDGDLHDYEGVQINAPVGGASEYDGHDDHAPHDLPQWIGENEEGTGLTLQAQFGPTHQWLLEL